MSRLVVNWGWRELVIDVCQPSLQSHDEDNNPELKSSLLFRKTMGRYECRAPGLTKDQRTHQIHHSRMMLLRLPFSPLSSAVELTPPSIGLSAFFFVLVERPKAKQQCGC